MVQLVAAPIVFPACWSRSPVHINPFPPWQNKANAKSSLDGSVVCPIITVQILNHPCEWRQERHPHPHPQRRKVVNIYTELLKFEFRSCVYNFINISTHETYILCQEAVGSHRVPMSHICRFRYQEAELSRKQHFTSNSASVHSVYTKWHQSTNRVPRIILTTVWCKLVPFSIEYILLYILKYLMRVLIFFS